MKKKSQTLADKILEYIRRNDNEEPIPAGFKSIPDWCKELKCTRRMWGIVLHKLLKTNLVKQVRLRRVDKGRIRVFNFYKIDESFLRLMRRKG